MWVRSGRAACAALVAFFLSAGGSGAVAQTGAPIRVAVDASLAAQKLYHVKVTMPAAPGDFTFVYPRWFPGYHTPAGPIEDVVSLRVLANGVPLEWRRDLVDFYAVHTTVPAGAAGIEVDFDVVGADSQNGQSSIGSTSQLAVIEYSCLLVYPQGDSALGTTVEASLTLPAGWTFGTALPVRAQNGSTVTFATATLYTLIDSPVITGAHEREYALGSAEYLDVASDSDAGAAVTPKFLAGLKHLVAEGPELYGGKHYRDYHFLLTLSDALGSDGIEHHESSDDRAPEKYAADDANYPLGADLLPHEYSHSWNGKYRRPADLAPPDFQQPEKTDLLWVYEGLNEYLGQVLAARAGLIDFRAQLDNLAMTAAKMEFEGGRTWRPVRDTADAAPLLFIAPREYANLRRTAGSFYSEGTLIWLEADVTIRRLTHGAKSLDDFCRLWGNGSDVTAAPVLNPYSENDVYALLGRVVPYDWAGFFHDRIATIQPHAPLGGISGYRLTYTDRESDLERGRDGVAKHSDQTYSLGAIVSTDGENDGTITDVLTQGPAFRAGLAPGMRIVAVDGRRWSAEGLQDALRRHKGTSAPLELIVSNGDFFSTVRIDARDGPRYPHLVRDASVPDELEKIYAPRTFALPAPAAGT